MGITKDSNILIVGLGLIGGSYARGFKEHGYKVCAIEKRPTAVEYALRENIVDNCWSYVNKEAVSEADIIVFALYPQVFKEWISENQDLFKPGALITDVTGVKTCVVYDIQNMLREDVEFIPAHPMAGREVYGVENSDSKIFRGANYIVVPTDKNTKEAIDTCKKIGEILGFTRISELTPEEHDEMIGFLSQLTHCIAVSLMTCKDNTHLVDYTGDSFRDLTRIARINENMWSELFMMNRDELLKQMDTFIDEFINFRGLLADGKVEEMKDKMRLSTERRGWFDKK